MTGIGATGGPATPGNSIDARRAEMKKAAEAFEAVFARQMIGSMRQASLGEDLFGSSATNQFREMSDAKVAESMAASGGLGIAKLMMQQFDRAEKAK